MKRNLKFTLLGVVLIVAAFLIVRAVLHKAEPAATRQMTPLVKVAEPKRETVRYTRQFNGDVLPAQQAYVYSKVSGNLERVLVDIGASVHLNQLLALVDTTELSQQYQQAAASYQNAAAAFERTKGLYEQSLASKQDMDNAQASQTVARALFETAATRLGYARITAPFDGIITKRFLDPGAVLTSSNSTLFTLMDLDRMKVTVNILEKDVPRIGNGTQAVIEVDAYPERKFEGVVSRLSEALDPATRTMAVQIDIPNPEHVLKPGMFAAVTLLVDEHPDALTVPSESVLKDESGYVVYVADQGKARRVRITMGTEQDNRIEILSGLEGSEQVIIAGQQLCKDGAAVTVQK